MTRQNQQNWNHIFSTFLDQVIDFTRLRPFRSIYQTLFYYPRKIPEIVHFIFLSTTTLHEEPNKIWFTQIGYPSPRYIFPKLAQKSEKKYTKPRTVVTDTRDPHVKRPHWLAT